MRKLSKFAAPLVALALVAAACGGDDDDDTTDPGTAAPAATEAEPAPEPTEAEAPEETTPEATTAEGTEAPEPETTEPETTTPPAGSIAGIEEGEAIEVGLIADLTGAFAGLVTEIAAAHEVFWDDVNEQGGIAGHPVNLTVVDAGYDVARTLELYEGLREDVDIITMSTGSPHTAAIAPMLNEDNLVTTPLSWYSGWAFGEVGQNVYETYTNYCIESMNGIEFLAGENDITKVAVLSFPGEYGQDGAAGAKKAIEALGLELVYDGEGLITPPSADNPNPDQSAVISGLVSSGAEMVWFTGNPATLGAIMGGAISQGFSGVWSGNSPSYSYKMLAVEQLAPLLAEYYFPSSYIVPWGADVPGMAEVVEKMSAARPDLPVSDVYVLAWTEGGWAKAVLEAAAAAGDLSREGIAEAAKTVEVNFQGLAPDQNWIGDPNDFVVRESFIYDIDLDVYDPVLLGDGGGATGNVILAGPYVGDVAAEFDFTEPCFVSG